MHARTMNQGENNRNTRRRILLPLEKQVMKLLQLGIQENQSWDFPIDI